MQTLRKKSFVKFSEIQASKSIIVNQRSFRVIDRNQETDEEIQDKIYNYVKLRPKDDWIVWVMSKVS